MANTPIKQRVSSPMVEAKEPEVNEGKLFDRALESVIGNLREMRNRGS